MGVLQTFEPLARTATVTGIFGIILAIFWYKFVARPRTKAQVLQNETASKAQRSTAMKQEFEARDDHNSASHAQSKFTSKNDGAEASMEISQLWVYPIKSLRGCQLPSATLINEGFSHDRKFVLLRVLEDSPLKVKHMAVSKETEMVLFHTSIEHDKLTVAYHPPGSVTATHKLEIPFHPTNFEKLERVDIDMHGSPTRSYNMGGKYNKWFSDLFGFKVILAYWGRNPRNVLGNLPGRPANESAKPKTIINNILQRMPVIGANFSSDDGVMAFNDCAPYLVITEKSSADVSSHLPDGVEMDITKFRANIVLKGSLLAFDEDFWGELRFGNDTKIILTGNCGRCVSLNVDYETGKPGTGEAGGILKILSKDRRVDPGVKYSPIFGRYGFVSKSSEGHLLKVGDVVEVSQRNEERTRFYWPGIST